MRRTLVVGLAILGAIAMASSASARVLRVGTYRGISGQFKSVEAAVNAAKPGDWILVAPGDYKTTSSRRVPGRSNEAAGILITKRNLRIRGMNRNTVILDGTKSGSRCSNKASNQNFGPSGSKGPLGLNGILIWKADDVSIQNLTACNFLSGSGNAGNEIWWNGGDGSYHIGGWGYNGSYLTATSTYFNTESTAAAYGIFSSNWSGGTWSQDYTSNFNDSGLYIGACQQQCDQTIDHAWSEYNALGYSGSNSGGWLLIKRSQFDNNQDGFDTNSQNGDNPPPQNGACPAGVKPPVKGAPSCWVFTNNYVHDNNNPNVPAAGTAAAGPVGTGMSVSGGRNDTIMHNRFVRNNAWGVILVAFPDMGPPCTGGTPNFPILGAGSCLYDDWGNAIINNAFAHNGSYGNPSNGDFDQLNLEAGHPTDCYSGNTELGGGSLTGAAAALEQMHPKCDGSAAPANTGGQFVSEVYCDSQLDTALCLPTDHYPRRTRVVMHPLPKLPTMPNPCAGVPTNPWCTRR
ncbi:MAG: hypothetical protein JO181_19565 [Solirubrobacterales bacterium]|nr:hypothetical protein [Solirubrobacterales bacterium]